MHARYFSALVLMLSVFSGPWAAAGSEPRLEGSVISASGVHATLYVVSPEANRARDVVVRFDDPILPRYVELSRGSLVSHDDGRESYLEVSTSLPFAFQRDAQEATKELHISSACQLFTPAHQIAVKVVFSRQLEDYEATGEATESVLFSFSEPLKMF